MRGAATPNIDKLAREGTKLLNFNVEPQCTPSRSCIMTGRHSIRSGTHSVPLTGGPYGLVQWGETIAKVLCKSGYATGHFGRWHLGNVPGRFPIDQGFDEWYGIADTTDETLWPTQPGFDPTLVHEAHIYDGERGSPSRKVQPYDLTARPEIDMVITDRAVAFMERSAAAKKPFYAYVPYTLVHYPHCHRQSSRAAPETANGPTASRRWITTSAACSEQ